MPTTQPMCQPTRTAVPPATIRITGGLTSGSATAYGASYALCTCIAPPGWASGISGQPRWLIAPAGAQARKLSAPPSLGTCDAIDHNRVLQAQSFDPAATFPPGIHTLSSCRHGPSFGPPRRTMALQKLPCPTDLIHIHALYPAASIPKACSFFCRFRRPRSISSDA